MGESKISAWRDRREWLAVFDLIFKTGDYETAANILSVWQVRVEKIAWAVICTGNVLAVRVMKGKMELVSGLELAYQNALASCLTQFIGLAIEKEYKRGQGASMTYKHDQILN